MEFEVHVPGITFMGSLISGNLQEKGGGVERLRSPWDWIKFMIGGSGIQGKVGYK